MQICAFSFFSLKTEVKRPTIELDGIIWTLYFFTMVQFFNFVSLQIWVNRSIMKLDSVYMNIEPVFVRGFFYDDIQFFGK